MTNVIARWSHCCNGQNVGIQCIDGKYVIFVAKDNGRYVEFDIVSEFKTTHDAELFLKAMHSLTRGV